MKYLKLYNNFNESLGLNREISSILDTYKKKLNDCFLLISDIYKSELTIDQSSGLQAFTVKFSFTIPRNEFEVENASPELIDIINRCNDRLNNELDAKLSVISVQLYRKRQIIPSKGSIRLSSISVLGHQIDILPNEISKLLSNPVCESYDSVEIILNIC